MARQERNIAPGVIVINKHEGVTSYRIIQIMRRMYGTKKVGHTGTLDPMATGVLPVLLGRGVKAADFLTAQDKEYRAGLRLGIETDTEDTTGEVIRTSDEIPTAEAVYAAAASFVGEYDQLPPMYSAIKIGGEKLVDIARRGGEAQRTPRRVHIYSIDIKQTGERDYELYVKCSKGTYIRTLCADIGKMLGCGGAMSSLRREKSGPFTLADAHTVEELETLDEAALTALVRPVESLFPDLPAVEVNDFYLKLIRGGTELYQKKLRTSFDVGTMVRIRHGGEFIALGQVEEFPDGTAVKPLKLFSLG